MVTRVGNEIIVNAAGDTDNLEAPVTAALSDGGFVVAWQDITNASSYTADLKVQMFGASGNKPEGEIDTGIAVATAPFWTLAITGLANDASVVAYTPKVGGGLQGVLLDSAGHVYFRYYQRYS